MKELYIRDEFIKLGQAIKLAGMAETGVDAKYMIEEGKVKVNGAVEIRRGKKLYDNDIFSLDGNDTVIKSKVSK